jgi:hypothetical protein
VRKVEIGSVLALIAGILAGPALGAPSVSIEKRTRIEIELRPLTASLVSEGEARRARLVLVSGEAEETKLRLAWPGPDDVSTLTMRAATAATLAGYEHTVDLDARLGLPDATVVHASRTVSFDDGETVLFEVYRHGEKSLTLAIELAATLETIVSSRPSPGEQVRFRIEIVRVLDGRQIPLENNYLNTLVGESVSYAFRLDNRPGADAVSITLKPKKLHADIAEIDIEISGKLPMEDEIIVIGRNERWMATRDATSTLAFETGEPPTGYRFLITARF